MIIKYNFAHEKLWMLSIIVCQHTRMYAQTATDEIVD